MRSFILPLLTVTLACPALADSRNAYEETRFVANNAKYNAPVVEDNFINAWGVAIRPKGAGGHFWVTARDTSYEYVGDVKNSPDEALRKLHTDSLKYVTLPVGGKDNFATGVVYIDSKKDFVITQEVRNAEPITAPAKFIFASDGGIISAWTERKKPDGTFDRAGEALTVIDESAKGAQFFGIATNASYDRLYAVNFGRNPGIQVYDGQFKPMAVTFDTPFDDNRNGKVEPGEYAPFNIQALQVPGGDTHLFVTYAKTRLCPTEEINKGTCAKGELFAGEEDTTNPGQGRLAEFTQDGALVAEWKDGGHLSAPWGLAYAPANFGRMSGLLLVGNFGDGTIAGFDPKTHQFVDVMRSPGGKPVVIEKLWGLVFGNGESLGDADTLYVAAGPDDEKDGLFTSLRLAK